MQQQPDDKAPESCDMDTVPPPKDGETKTELPQRFPVRYLGSRGARGLWGMKHTRRPVDELVSAARNLKAGTTLPLLQLDVSTAGVTLREPAPGTNEDFYPIEYISYGVQDLVYTRVFAMIIVHDTNNVLEENPFVCHVFVCTSRQSARTLTLALAAAFQEYGKSVKSRQGSALPRKFAIDLRRGEEDPTESDMPQDSEA